MDYPTTLATKEDYEFVRKNFSKDLWEKDFSALLETQYDWFFEKTLTDEDESVAQSITQKIVVDPQTGVKSLYVWKKNPQCKLAQLGYTEDEVVAFLKGVDNA